MDPAGVLIDYDNTTNRLDSTDAQSTIVLHTSSVLGFPRPLGTVDFYANGGIAQPGCASDIELCSHSRSYDFFGEAINSNLFVARQCWHYFLAFFQLCFFPTKLFKGDGTVNYSSGTQLTYNFMTHGMSPYGLG